MNTRALRPPAAGRAGFLIKPVKDMKMMTDEKEPGAGKGGDKKVVPLSQQASARKPAKAKSLNLIELLEIHRRGDIVSEADDAIQDVVSRVTEFGGKGSVTVKLNIVLGKGGVIELQPTVERKSPARPISPGIYFDQGDGTLGRYDPRQTHLEEQIGLVGDDDD